MDCVTGFWVFEELKNSLFHCHRGGSQVVGENKPRAYFRARRLEEVYFVVPWPGFAPKHVVLRFFWNSGEFFDDLCLFECFCEKS